jgi:hypothetical protein
MKTTTFLFLLLFPYLTTSTNINLNFKNTDEAAREKIALDMLNSFAREDYDGVSKNFYSSLKQTSTNEKLAEIWEAVNTQVGKYVKVLTITPSMFGEYHQLKIRCNFEKDNLTLYVAFTEDDRIIAFNFNP